jgi:hypothetical protein
MCQAKEAEPWIQGNQTGGDDEKERGIPGPRRGGARAGGTSGGDERVRERADEGNSVPYGSFGNVLMTKEWNPLESGVLEYKYYAPGTGLIGEEQILDGTDTSELWWTSGPGGSSTIERA